MKRSDVFWIGISGVGVLGLAYVINQAMAYRPPSVPPLKQKPIVCPRNCPMLRGNKCVASKCILQRRKTGSPVKQGEKEEVKVNA